MYPPQPRAQPIRINNGIMAAASARSTKGDIAGKRNSQCIDFRSWRYSLTLLLRNAISVIAGLKRKPTHSLTIELAVNYCLSLGRTSAAICQHE
jgi:hypothetical protein